MSDNSLHTHTSRESCIDRDRDDRIADMADRQARFSGYIDRWWDDVSVRQLAGVLAVHGRTAVRLGQFLRDRRGVGGFGEPPMCIDEVIADLNDNLDRLSRHIDERWDELDSGRVKLWCRLVTVYSQNCVRLGQLMGVRRAVREEWGIEL